MADSVSLLLKALEFAAVKHCGQRRKGADAAPYINHPIAVANILCNEGGVTDPVVLAAAVLHDTIEDTGTSREQLKRLFGPDVARIVLSSHPIADRPCLKPSGDGPHGENVLRPDLEIPERRASVGTAQQVPPPLGGARHSISPAGSK